MSGEAQEQITKEQATAAFMNGFDDEEDTPTETPAVQASTETIEQPQQEQTKQPEPPEHVQITKAEWDSLNARAAKVDEIEATHKRGMDQAFGKMGELTRRLNEMQAATPKGEPMQVSDADFDELAKEGYQEIASLTAKGLNKILSRFKGTGVDLQAIEKMVGDRLAGAVSEVRSEIVNSSLEAIYPNWMDTVNSKEFSDWISSKPGWSPMLNDKAATDLAMSDPNSALRKWIQANPNEPVSMMLSSKFDDASKMLRLFVQAQQTPAKPAPKPQTTQAPAAQPTTRQRQIAASVTPKGAGASPAPTPAKSPFWQGFESDD